MKIALSALQQRHFLTGTGRYIAELYRHLPRIAPGAREIEIDGTALTMLLDGIDLRLVPRVDHWQPPTQR